ncbi:MAG TPA: hypothetical protein VEL76_18115 [Gemmataceae bacterium]|nr:hypothetical protein [Gemmataceae bacterium]
MRRLGLLLGTSLLLWGLLVYPAYALGGEQQVACSAVALLLCLVPAAVTMAWAEATFHRSPQQYLLIILGGTGVRLFAVLAAALVVSRMNEYFQDRSFWLWILAFYLITLTLEMVFLLAGRTGDKVTR